MLADFYQTIFPRNWQAGQSLVVLPVEFLLKFMVGILEKVLSTERGQRD